MNTHVVTRPFEGPAGRQFEAGEKVDASDWRNTAMLVEQRRLRPISPKDMKASDESSLKKEGSNRGK